jgi:hypothetical protein
MEINIFPQTKELQGFSAEAGNRRPCGAPVSLSSQIMLGSACLAVGAVVAWLNRYHEVQSGIYRGQYLALAKYLLGEAEQPLITYPLWGYPLLLSLLPSPEITSVALQLVISIMSLVLLYSSTAPHLVSRAPLAILCVLAVPWYALASVRLADIYAASFGVMAICLLARAINTEGLWWSVASGTFFGTSLNFRSDFLALLCVLLILALIFAQETVAKNWRRLAIVFSLAVLLMVPWGVFRVYHGNSFGITSTNTGMVLYNSLGFPGNAWHIVSSDKIRTLEVKEALGTGVDPASEEGNVFFRRRFLATILSDPTEFARKIVYNFVATLKLGFYTIETWTFLSQEERLQFEVLKEQLKWFAGAKPHLVRIEEFRRRGLWDENFSLASVTPRQWVLVAYPIANSAFSALYLGTVLLATGWIVAVDRARLREPIFLFCLIGTLSVFFAIALVQYEPRQANILYPLGMPLIAVLFEWAIPAKQSSMWHTGSSKSSSWMDLRLILSASRRVAPRLPDR